MKSFGLIINLEKERSIQVATQIIEFFKERKIEVLLPPSNAKAVGYPDLTFMEEKLPENMDCILVLGGDGTFLNTARTMADKDIPILGINLGQLGFLTEIDPEDLFEGLQKLLDGQYYIEERMMLKASVERGGLETESFTALNDIVVTKGAFARMIELKTYVGSQYVATYPADGLIISSPTGSTAYSLSAGGPIVAPELEVMIFTPICPHTLHARPMIINPNECLKVTVLSKQSEVMLTVDGQHGFKLQEGDIISITKSKYTTKLVRLKDRCFYSVLREKLRDGECR
ncbi:MAG: kinase [Clostridia bacterium]|jgi:NAD+ kinase|nr:kinase [Clostridia bacterium]